MPVGYNSERDEKERKFRRMLAFVVGMGGGPEGQGMPRDVFRVVVEMLTLPWEPLWIRGSCTQPSEKQDEAGKKKKKKQRT